MNTDLNGSVTAAGASLSSQQRHARHGEHRGTEPLMHQDSLLVKNVLQEILKLLHTKEATVDCLRLEVLLIMMMTNDGDDNDRR